MGPAAHPGAVSAASFQPGVQLRPYLQAGQLPTSVATGDFNRDGHMDFVVANGLTNDLWIYFGRGDGTFELPRIVPLSKGLAPVCVVAGELRGNGILDLVVAETDTATVGVLLGNGDGTFGYEQIYTLPEPPSSVVIDDFHHAGKLDIAAVMVTAVDPGTAAIPYLALLTGDGTGNFAAPVITTNTGFFSSAWNLASADVNGDGLPDVLITGPGLENSQIYLNNGDGTFKPGQVVLGNSDIISLLDGRLADVNGDHCADAVLADASSFVWVAMGDCTGGFGAPVPFPTGDSNAALRVADVNGDGSPDVVTATLPAILGYGMVAGNTLTVMLGDGKGNFLTARNYVGTSQAYSIGIADFNEDGSPDVVTANNDSDTVTVYVNDKAGGFGFPQGIYAGVPGQLTIDAPISALSFADLNDDGKPDAFLVDTAGANGEYYATAFLNDGTAKLAGPISSDTGINIVNNHIGDYRLGNFRDAKHVDMVAIGTDVSFSDSIQCILFLAGNGDGTFAKGIPVAATGADGSMAMGDFNHDGQLDFVAVNGQGPYTVTTFLGNGDGTFHALPSITINGSLVFPVSVWTGDFNRDGKLDVLIFASGNGYFTTGSTVWELLGNGDGTFQPARQLFSGFQPFALADLNGDGYLDIARYDFMWPDGKTQTVGPAKFTSYLGQPDGSFLQSSEYALYQGVPKDLMPYPQQGDPTAWSVTGDFNGDGRPEEVAFQGPYTWMDWNYAQFLMGNGDGTFTPTYDEFLFSQYGYPQYAHDLDGDGIADIVEVDQGTSSLHVIKGGRAPGLQIAMKDPVAVNSGGCGWVFPNLASTSAQTVSLSSLVAGVTLPTSVTVPAGATSVEFCYTLAPNFDWRQVFDINAQLNGDTATALASDSYVLGFTESVFPTTLPPVYAGQASAPMTITLTSSQNYSSSVRLYCENLTPGDSCQFGSSTLSLSPAAPVSTIVNLVAGPDSAKYSSTANFTIVADDGNIIHRRDVTLTVATLTIQGPPAGYVAQAVAGGSATIAFAVTGIPPFELTCSGLPAGATCSFSGTQVVFPAPSALTATVSVASGVATGSYPFTLTATSHSFVASITQTLQVISFSVQSPTSASDWLLPGYTQTVPVVVQGSAGGTGAGVVLTCSLDVTATCTGGTSTLPKDGIPFDLTVMPRSGTPLGLHQLNVSATYGGVTQNYMFPIYVVSFTGSLNPSSLTLTRGGSGTVTVTLNASTGFNGPVGFSCGATLAVSCAFNPGSLQMTGGTSQTVTLSITAGLSAALEHQGGEFSGRLVLAFAFLLPLAIWRPTRRRGSMFIVAFVIVAFASCGGGRGGVGGGGGGSDSYTLSPTATLGNAPLSVPLGALSLTVNH
jgi:hypothetical protein